jgi:phospholipid/cholesterol/gamma-HCH transport system ATP-binding protein
MIRFSNVFLKFDGRQILRNVSMDVPAGQTQVILGGSGCGKTTTLRLILGLLHPESGSIVINGQEIVGLTERQMAPIRAQMAMVFQGAALFDSLTVRENVGYRLWEDGMMDTASIEHRVAESLRFVGLEDTMDKMPAELSGGMKKRVAIARALACKPKIILYDEPTAGLDPINTHLVSELVCRLHAEERVTQIVVTHDLECAYRIADRLIMIHRGEAIFDGSVDALQASDDPRIRTFLRPDEVLAEPGCFPHKDGGIRVVSPMPEKAEQAPA